MNRMLSVRSVQPWSSPPQPNWRPSEPPNATRAAQPPLALARQMAQVIRCSPGPRPTLTHKPLFCAASGDEIARSAAAARGKKRERMVPPLTDRDEIDRGG